MTNKWTAAHWGTYRIERDSTGPVLRPDPDDPHPSKIGEGWLDAMKNTDTRVMRPSVRKGWLDGRDQNRCGDAHFVELPWDEALDLLGDELRRILTTHGNEAIFAGSYGWASAGRFHHAQSQLRRFLNTIGGYTGSVNTYSHAGAEVLLPYITGLTKPAFQDQMTSWPLIAQHCETLLAFGGISKRPAQIDSSGTSRHDTPDWLDKAAANGCDLINISPIGSDMSGAAQWIAPRPGTDTALMLALTHEVFINGHADHAFLKRYTQGADMFEAYVMGKHDGIPKTPDWAAKICDIPRQSICDLAQKIATTKTMITLSWSMQRADRGELTLWAGLGLACVLGQIGAPGTGFGFGYGSTEPVGRAYTQINWPSLPQGKNPVADLIPVARVADMLAHPGGQYTYDGQTRRYPDARLVWWSGGNPFHHHQDITRLDRLWQRPETVVVMDHSWTATARRADIVLPTTSPLERDDLMINRRDPALVYMSAALDPMGEARDDYAILSDLATRLGTATAFTKGRSSGEWQRDIWAQCQARAKADRIDLPDFDNLRAMGRWDVPDTKHTQILFSEFISDPDTNPLQTQSGKIELFSNAIKNMNLPDCPPYPQWAPPVVWLGDATPDQLHLLSGQPDTRLHAQNDAGPVSQASKIKGREPCCLHPDTALRFGLADGDIALIKNAQGACLAGVTTSAEMRADCLWLATGAWLDLRHINGQAICVHGNPNVLTIDKGSTGLSQGNIAHTALVQVSKWDGPLPVLTAHKPPRFVKN